MLYITKLSLIFVLFFCRWIAEVMCDPKRTRYAIEGLLSKKRSFTAMGTNASVQGAVPLRRDSYLLNGIVHERIEKKNRQLAETLHHVGKEWEAKLQAKENENDLLQRENALLRQKMKTLTDEIDELKIQILKTAPLQVNSRSSHSDKTDTTPGSLSPRSLGNTPGNVA